MPPGEGANRQRGHDVVGDEESQEGKEGRARASQSVSRRQPLETAGLPLASWLAGVSPATASQKEQIPRLEQERRLLDLAKRGQLPQSN